MQAPGTVKVWMSDGAGGHQCIGYGGEAYRWNAPGNRTPHEVGGAAGFWVSHQRRLDAEAAKAAEQAAAAAHAAASTGRTTTSSLLDSLRSGIMPPRPPTHWRVGSFGGPRLFLISVPSCDVPDVVAGLDIDAAPTQDTAASADAEVEEEQSLASIEKPARFPVDHQGFPSPNGGASGNGGEEGFEVSMA